MSRRLARIQLSEEFFRGMLREYLRLPKDAQVLEITRYLTGGVEFIVESELFPEHAEFSPILILDPSGFQIEQGEE